MERAQQLEDQAKMKALLSELLSRDSRFLDKCIIPSDIKVNHYRVKQRIFRQMGDVDQHNSGPCLDQDGLPGEKLMDLFTAVQQHYNPIQVDSKYIGSFRLRSASLLSKKARLIILDE